MSASEILAAVTGTGGALAVLLLGCWLLITGKIVPKSVVADKDRQIAQWQQAHAAERARADAAVLAVQTTNQVLYALHRETAP